MGENDVSLNRHSVSAVGFWGVNFLAWVVNNDYLQGGGRKRVYRMVLFDEPLICTISTGFDLETDILSSIFEQKNPGSNPLRPPCRKEGMER